MRVNFHRGTFEITIHLTDDEAQRLIAVINREVHSTADPGADTAAQLEDALKDLLT